MDAETAYYLAMWAARQLKEIRAHTHFYHTVIGSQSVSELHEMEIILWRQVRRFSETIKSDADEPDDQIASWLSAISRELALIPERK